MKTQRPIQQRAFLPCYLCRKTIDFPQSRKLLSSLDRARTSSVLDPDRLLDSPCHRRTPSSRSGALQVEVHEVREVSGGAEPRVFVAGGLGRGRVDPARADTELSLRIKFCLITKAKRQGGQYSRIRGE